jgi:hypothetical protein
MRCDTCGVEMLLVEKDYETYYVCKNPSCIMSDVQRELYEVD